MGSNGGVRSRSESDEPLDAEEMERSEQTEDSRANGGKVLGEGGAGSEGL